MKLAVRLGAVVCALQIASCSEAIAQGITEETARELVEEYIAENPGCVFSSLVLAEGGQADVDALVGLIQQYIVTANGDSPTKLYFITNTPGAQEAPIPDSLAAYVGLFSTDESRLFWPYSPIGDGEPRLSLTPGNVSVSDGQVTRSTVMSLVDVCLLRTQREINIVDFTSSGDEAFLEFTHTYQSPRPFAPIIGLSQKGLQSWERMIQNAYSDRRPGVFTTGAFEPFRAYLVRYDQGWRVTAVRRMD